VNGAQAEYTRQVGMLKQNATSQANVDKALSDRDQAAANLAMAKIQLGYTTVSSPFDGRIGTHLVDVGNVVGTNAAAPTKLATIDELVPIYINFSVSSRDALRLRKIAQKLGAGVQPGVGKIPVFAGLDDEDGFPHKGVLDFANSSVDTGTGTIQLRGIFGNEEKILFPGLFARVRIPLGEPAPALVVPNSALANDQIGDYLFVVNAQNIVERRNVTLGARAGAMCAITDGLTENDRVIVNGQSAVRPGATVTPQEAPASSAPAATTGRNVFQVLHRAASPGERHRVPHGPARRRRDLPAPGFAVPPHHATHGAGHCALSWRERAHHGRDGGAANRATGERR
jgi:RND family efflux transporter MFP subunit